jgi:HlyD family secretion protein
MEDRAGGSFTLRPATRAEVRAQVAGFLQEVYYAEGDHVSPGQTIARLQIPDLTSRIAQKEAEMREAHARLRLLEAGPRPEEVVQQRRRVQRARGWRDLASQDLAKMRQALQADLALLQGKIVQYHAELDFAQKSDERARELAKRKAISEEQLQEIEKKRRVAQAQMEQAQAQKKMRQAQGTLEAEAELARREKELADAQATLILLEAGTRPEEIDAQRAQLARLEEENRYLKSLQEKLLLCSSVRGVITTAPCKESGSEKKTQYLKERLREKIGQYFREGDLICEVEEQSILDVELSLAEQDATRVRVGQPVAVKIRASPFHTFQTHVDRIDSRAVPGEGQSTVTIYCRLENPEAKLIPGMTGYARVYSERQSLGAIALERLLRFLRTEFWW